MNVMKVDLLSASWNYEKEKMVLDSLSFTVTKVIFHMRL